ncbi:MAG: hypothetical protein WC515_03475 [Candidatus Omnitrophota bacterium]
MVLKNLSKRERYIAFGTVALAASAAIYALIVEPVTQRWGRLNAEAMSRSAALKKDSKLISSYKTIEADYARISKFAKARKGGEEGLADMLTYIENISRNDSCAIVNIKPMGTKDFGDHKEVLIDVTAEADLTKFSRFLYDIENDKDMILRVKHFTISSRSTQEGSLRGTFLISKLLIE